MLAQERSTSVISENIANSTTTGYKRSNAAFHELVANGRFSTHDQGSVTATNINRIRQQGAIQNSSSNTDIAVAGNGMFAVRSSTDPTAETLFTRNGSFSPDKDGFLRNTAGFILYGWPIENGVAAIGPTTDSLQPIDSDELQNTSLPTTFMDMTLNLDADQTPINPHTIGTGQQLPVSNQASHFTRSIEVYDANGAAHNITLEFRATTGPMAHFSSASNLASSTGMEYSDLMVDVNGATPSIADGDTLDIDGNIITFRAANPDPLLNEVSTFQELITMINSFTGGGGEPLYTARRDERGELTVQANDPSVTIDLTASSATVLAAGGLGIIQDPDGADYTFEPDAALDTDGVANPNQTMFPEIANTSNPNPYHWWEMRVMTADPAAPSSGNLVEISKGLINFNGDGSINATADAEGRMIIDLGDIDFDSSETGEETAIQFDISSFTQASGNYQVLDSNQNGTPLGSFTGVEITPAGIVQAVFSNGQRVDVHQIALAQFANPDGLERVDGTAFRVSADSGEAEMFAVGDGGTGLLTVSGLEASNVDIAEEFSSLIVNQRAYSLNSRVITTVDEMTENLAQLKR